MMVRFGNGDRSRFRYVAPQARSGILVDPLPRHIDDVAALFRGECPRSGVEALRLLPPEGPTLPPTPRLTLWRIPAGDAYRCD
jgi:hypothetical protein